jgi:hypothetical protein
MAQFEIIHMETDQALFQEMQNFLNDTKPFISSPSSLDNPYEILPYIHAHHDDEMFIGSLVDLNVFTTLVKLGQGEDINGDDDNAKISCALMYFYILSGIAVEPNIALYERAQKSSHEQALAELKFFRIADNAIPDIYAEIALGRRKNLLNSGTLTKPKIASEVPDNEFSKQLNHWKLNYLYLLKVAEIEKTKGLSGKEKMELFIRWMFEETLLNNVVTHFASMFFSPARKSGMLKGIGSDNQEDLKKGLQNAAWDLTYLRTWQHNYKKNELWLFSTRDQALHQLAKNLFIDNLEALFTPYWSKEEATCLRKNYEALNEQFRSLDEKVKHQQDLKQGFDQIISEYEQKLNLV